MVVDLGIAWPIADSGEERGGTGPPLPPQGPPGEATAAAFRLAGKTGRPPPSVGNEGEA